MPKRVRESSVRRNVFAIAVAEVPFTHVRSEVAQLLQVLLKHGLS